MKQQYDQNPLKKITFQQAVYIHDNSPVNSQLWTDSGCVMYNYQQSLQNNQYTNILNKLPTKE